MRYVETLNMRWEMKGQLQRLDAGQGEHQRRQVWASASLQLQPRNRRGERGVEFKCACVCRSVWAYVWALISVHFIHIKKGAVGRLPSITVQGLSLLGWRLPQSDGFSTEVTALGIWAFLTFSLDYWLANCCVKNCRQERLQGQDLPSGAVGPNLGTISQGPGRRGQDGEGGKTSK